MSTFYCDFLLFRSALCPKRTKHSAIFTEKWKTFQSRLTLGPTGPPSPSSPCKPGGPYMLTKIFVSSFKGESKSKGGAGVRERERQRESTRLPLLWPGLKSRPGRHFRNGKGTGDEMRPQVFMGWLLGTRRPAIGHF